MGVRHIFDFARQFSQMDHEDTKAQRTTSWTLAFFVFATDGHRFSRKNQQE